jgi:membrane-associated phospholipid phosphatase
VTRWAHSYLAVHGSLITRTFIECWQLIGVADFKSALKIAPAKTDGNLFVKRATVFYWLIGIVIAAIAIATAFHFDDTARDFIAQHQSAAMRNFMRNVSLFGDWPSHVVLGLLLLGIAWRRHSKKWIRIFLSMLLAMAIAGVVGTVIKRTVPRARPSVKSELRWGGPHFSTKYHALPSGHVAASTAFFGVLIFTRRRIGLACLPIPILIGFSRMYLGAHYLSDVVCAAVLGIGCSLVVVHFFLCRVRDSGPNTRTTTSTSTT